MGSSRTRLPVALKTALAMADADAALGADRARELASHLSFMVTNTDLQVLEGNRVIELKTAGIDKGTAAARLIDELRPDFILAIGDDRTDEDTFRALPWSAWMVKVGEASTSRARFSVDSLAVVRSAAARCCGGFHVQAGSGRSVAMSFIISSRAGISRLTNSTRRPNSKAA